MRSEVIRNAGSRNAAGSWPVVDPEILTKVNYCPPAIATQAVIQMSVNPLVGVK